MSWLTGHWDDTWVVAAKAVLLYATALAGLRLGSRRTLVQMSPFDFVTAVAMGAVIGRTATASGTPFTEGAVAVLTLVAIHRLTSVLRYIPAVRHITDHRIRVLVAYGRVRRRQLWICGLTMDDLRATLRQQGLTRLDQARLVLYERAGGLTIVRGECRGELVEFAFSAAADEPRSGRGERAGCTDHGDGGPAEHQ